MHISGENVIFVSHYRKYWSLWLPNRKYAIYNHKMDDTIKEAINDGLTFQHVKKKLFKAFPSVAEDFKGSKKFIGKHVFSGEFKF